MKAHMLAEFVAYVVGEWTPEVAQMERRGQREAAALLKSLCVDLQEHAEHWLDERLTLAEAAETSGVSYSTLQHLVAVGDIRNAGHRGRPRVHRGDLPYRRTDSPLVQSNDDVGEDLIDEVLLQLEE